MPPADRSTSVSSPTEHPSLDIARVVRVLDQHHVEYLLVGGVAAAMHGASRPTFDVDCLPRRSVQNLRRLAAAMRELNARLHVEGLDDAESALLPVQLDEDMLARMEISTWRTDAGDLDVLADIPDSHGRPLCFEELASRAKDATLEGVAVRVAAFADIIASKEWAGRPKDHQALPELHELEVGSSWSPPPGDGT